MPDPTPCPKCGQVHERCAGHSKKTGGPCGRWPTRGATVCRSHGAGAPQVRAAAARNVAVEEARRTLGLPIEVDPADAMIAMVHEAAGNVALYRELVQTLERDADRAEGDEKGPYPGQGLAGLTGSTSKWFDAAPHVWVTMYDQERERLVRWSKACRDAGVDERRVAIAESQAEQVARAMIAASGALLAMVLALDGVAELRQAIEGAWRSKAPAIMRQALLEASSTERNSDG